MRHIREQLTPRAIGFDQLRLARREIGGHAIEGIRDRGHLISADRRGARREIAFAKPVGGVFEGAKPRLRRPEDHERGDRGTGNEQQEHAERQRRADRLGETAQSGERRDPDHGDDRLVVLDRRHYWSTTWRTEHPRHAAVRRRPSGAVERRGTATVPRPTGIIRPTTWTTDSANRSATGTTLRTTRTAAAAPEWSGESHASRDIGSFRRDRCSVGKNDRGRAMQLLHATFRIRAQIELGIARERGLELGCDELGEVAAHALGHAAFGFSRDPDEEADLQDQRDG